MKDLEFPSRVVIAGVLFLEDLVQEGQIFVHSQHSSGTGLAFQ